eukprot:1385167-Amorphochlora_amoeboformis.AAC.1
MEYSEERTRELQGFGELGVFVPAHGEPRSLRVKSRQGRIPHLNNKTTSTLGYFSSIWTFHLWVVLPEFPGVLSEWDSPGKTQEMYHCITT